MFFVCQLTKTKCCKPISSNICFRCTVFREDNEQRRNIKKKTATKRMN